MTASMAFIQHVFSFSSLHYKLMTLYLFIYFSGWQVWTFSKRKMCVHHEIFLPSLPLCTEWLYCPLLGGGGRGNLLAVGSTEPSIDIWDLDPVSGFSLQLFLVDVFFAEYLVTSLCSQIDVVKPCVVLRGTDGHTDSVLGLAWNTYCSNLLASASADKRVKFWDIVAGRCDNTMEHHSGKARIMLESKYFY